MGRPKTYNRDEVLENALLLFWRKGFEGAHLQELVEATGGGIITDDFVETLRELLTNPAELRRLGQAGHDAVVNDFSVETMAENMISVYNALLK